MQYQSVLVATVKTGRWKVYVTGQADAHISDWNGCNFRYASVTGQPHAGFATDQEAIAWATEFFKTDDDAEKWVNLHVNDGTHLGDSFYKTRQYRDIRLPKKIRPPMFVRVVPEKGGPERKASVIDVDRHTFRVKFPRRKKVLGFRRNNGKPTLTNRTCGLIVVLEDLPQLESW